MSKHNKENQLELGSKVWENYTPITKDKKNGVTTFDIFIQSEIETPAAYNEVCYVLGNMKKKNKVNLHICSPGGYLDSAFKLVEAIDNCKAEITGILTGTVASAGTILALRCDKLIVPQHLHFMIHNYSGGAIGKGNEIIEHAVFSNKELKEAFANIYGGFLTKKEIRNVIKDRDFWMGSAEVGKRFAKMKGN